MCRNSIEPIREALPCAAGPAQGGFTLVEAVVIIVLLGILAVVALPKLSTGGFVELGFRDRTVAALRFAQKTATSHRRAVCVAFTATSVTLSIDYDGNGSCDGPLNLPGSASNTVSSGAPSQAYFSPVPANFSFQPDGRGADRTIAIPGQTAILVYGATGHVQ